MELGEKALPTGVAAGRYAFRRVCLGMLLAQAVVSPSGPEYTISPEQTGSTIVYDQTGSYEMANPDSATIVIELPSDPVIAEIATTTTTFLPPPETTTTTTSPPPPETTTTTEPDESCEEIRDDVFELVQPAAGYTVECTELIGVCHIPEEDENDEIDEDKDGDKKLKTIRCDGNTDTERNVITLYFGDTDDPNSDKEFTVGHEIFHSLQDVHGILAEEKDVVDPKTGQAVIDPKTGKPLREKRYSREEVEQQADDFAWGLGLRNRYHQGTWKGFRFVCQLLRDHGANIC